MFIPIKYGIERSPIDMGEYLIKCPSCETDQWAEIMVYSVYSHFYYIPILPNDKDAMVICKKCGLKRDGVPFNSNLISNYHEVKNKSRHKWFTYVGVIILTLPFLAWMIFLLIQFIN